MRIFKKKQTKSLRDELMTILSNMGGGAWEPGLGELIREGYEKCGAVFGAIQLIVKGAGRVKWYVINDKGEEVERGGLVELLRSVNPMMSWGGMVEMIITHILLAGNAYVMMIKGSDDEVKELWVLRPDRVKAINGDDGREVEGWEIMDGMGRKKRVAAGEILELREPNPLYKAVGVSRLRVVARDVAVLNASKDWNYNLIKNDMKPSGIFNFEGELTAEQREELRLVLAEDYAGENRAGKFIITEGKGNFTPTMINPKDLDWVEGQKFAIRQICSVFGVASELLGDSENKTYSNYREARKALYEETILPFLDMIAEEFNRWMMRGGERLVYDKDGIEALQEERMLRYGYLKDCDWTTVNEKREETGYGRVEGGDVVLIGGGKMPLGYVGEDFMSGVEEDKGLREIVAERGGEGGKKVNKKGMSGGYWRKKEKRELLWAKFEERTRRREAVFQVKADEYLRRQGRRLVEELERYEVVGRVDGERLLDVKKEGERVVKEFKGWYLDQVMRAGEAGVMACKKMIWEDEEEGLLIVDNGVVVGIKKIDGIERRDKWEFVLAKEREEELNKMIFESGTKVAKTTIARIKALIIKGVEENWTIKELSKEIWMEVVKFLPWRSRLWAETESTKIENWAMLEGYKESKLTEGKGWHCALIETSREEHVEADGQEVKLDEYFEVGGEKLMYPGDPRGSAWNVCNCRCSQYPVVE